MICPKCNYERQERDSIVPDWQCPKCGLAYAKVKANLDKSIRLRLTSGYEFRCSKIKLYDLKLVQEFDRLKHAASKNLAGFSTGIGFWGDLEWVALGSFVTGVIENSVSNEMQSQATNQLLAAASLAKRIRETAAFVHISTIENIKYPEVALWRSTRIEGQKADMVHIASNYVFMEVDGKEVAVFWDKVEEYEVV